jgi:hypothetical protein
MIAKVCIDRQEFAEAIQHYDRAIGLVRTRDELQLLMKV